MAAITHHTPDALLTAYAAGNLPHPFAVVIAAHISLCVECRAAYEAHHAVGGAVLESHNPEKISAPLKTNVLNLLDALDDPKPEFERSGIYPGPIMSALKGKPPRWRRLGGGVKQTILSTDQSGSVRLLYIPPGQAIPDHTHGGLELTLVLQGSFSDETGQFGVGDLEVADEALEHTPIAGLGAPCICLAATDAPLKFNTFIPRLLQPFFQI